MQRPAFTALALGAALYFAAPAQAQIGVYNRPLINPRPTVSPYLNIFRGGSGAVNYYGVVRPQMETARQIYALQQEVAQMPPPMLFPAALTQGLPPPDAGSSTGHPVAFQYHSHFYGRGGGGGGSPPVAGGAGNPLGRPNLGQAQPSRPIVAGVVATN
jgi:hypothetical protein